MEATIYLPLLLFVSLRSPSSSYSSRIEFSSKSSFWFCQNLRESSWTRTLGISGGTEREIQPNLTRFSKHRCLCHLEYLKTRIVYGVYIFFASIERKFLDSWRVKRFLSTHICIEFRSSFSQGVFKNSTNENQQRKFSWKFSLDFWNTCKKRTL